MIGREAELSTIDGFLASPGDGFAVLALEGEPGIGKTTVWREGVSRARASGYQVLSCRPAQSEARMSFVGLVDLLAPVADEALRALPGPQRDVLAVALLRAPAGRRRIDQRTVSVAFLSLMRSLAGTQQVLLAVDDAQWLDRASAAVLEFATRRLDKERVRGLTAVRLVDEPMSAFDHVAGERRRPLRLGSLSVGSLHEMIKGQLEQAFARPTLIKIAELSGGNPFYALEIARALSTAGEPGAGEPLPVPEELGKLVGARIRRLPASSREALLVASALSAPTLELVDAAGLKAAERAGIVRLMGDGRVEFTHPLFASAVYEAAPPTRRREVHAELARRVGDLEERARHLALSAPEQAEDVAAVLEAGAAKARSRGAWHSAAELLEESRALTPANLSDSWRRRGIDAADCYARAGDRARSRRVLEEVLAETPGGSFRGHALLLLAEITHNEASFPEALGLLKEAAQHTSDPRLGARIEIGISFVLANGWDAEGAIAAARRALALAEETGDELLIGVALAFWAMMGYLAGHGVDWGLVERSLEFDDVGGVLPLYSRPGAIAGFLLLYTGRLSEARERLLAQRAWALEHGDESDLAFVLYWLVWLETLSGDYRAATAHAEDAIRFATLTGGHSSLAWIYAMRGLLRAHTGEIEAARADCARAATMADETGFATAVRWVAAAKCRVELTVGDPGAAWLAAEPLVKVIEQEGIREPQEAPFLPDAIEALISLGQLDRASALLDTFVQRAQAVDRAWALATGGRCGGLLLAARGELSGAEVALGYALTQHDRLEMPFERARTLLCLGRVQRRGKRRKAARERLGEALEIFENLGAPLWAEKTRAELERTHVREAPTDLTPSEDQVAQLAARGLKNREIAERLYLSPKTVEANLARAYRKLGVRSRAELGAAMATQAPGRSS